MHVAREEPIPNGNEYSVSTPGVEPCMSCTAAARRGGHTCSSALLMRWSACSALAAATISSSGFCNKKSRARIQKLAASAALAAGWAHGLQFHAHDSQDWRHPHVHSRPACNSRGGAADAICRVKGRSHLQQS
jgi:hypothetical protein